MHSDLSPHSHNGSRIESKCAAVSTTSVRLRLLRVGTGLNNNVGSTGTRLQHGGRVHKSQQVRPFLFFSFLHVFLEG